MNFMVFLRLLLLTVFLSLGFIAADCTQTTEVTPGDFYGRWALIYNAGDIRDICPGEIVNYTNTGTAYLKCPGRDSVQTNFTLQDGVLTYSTTNIQYKVQNVTTENMELIGLNVDRYLIYSRDVPASSTVRYIKPLDMEF